MYQTERKENTDKRAGEMMKLWSSVGPTLPLIKIDTRPLMQHNCHHCSVADHVLLKKRCVNNLKR